MVARGEGRGCEGRRTWLRMGFRVLLDVAHNPASAKYLAEYVKGLGFKGYIHGVFGIYGDKNISGVTQAFKGQFKTWHLTNMDEARAAGPTEIMLGLPEEDRAAVFTYAKIDSALEGVSQMANKDDLVLVFGSFAVVSGALEYLKNYNSKN